MARTFTTTKRVANLTPKEFKECYSLNLRGNGLMRGQLVTSRKYNEDAYATLIRNKNDGTLDGWALVFTTAYPGSNFLDAYFYVRKQRRRNKIGKKLVKHVSSRFGQVRVFPHDITSDAFFDYVHDQRLNVDLQDDYM